MKVTHEELKNNALQNPDVKKAYDALQKEFEKLEKELEMQCGKNM